MAKIKLKRGTAKELEQEPLKDGLLSFTVDDGRIHLDYVNKDNKLTRKTFYSGKLTIGKHVYDGTEDVSVDQYEGQYSESESN